MKSRIELEMMDSSSPFSVSESCASGGGDGEGEGDGDGEGVGVRTAFLLEALEARVAPLASLGPPAPLALVAPRAPLALPRGFLPGGIRTQKMHWVKGSDSEKERSSL